jgi:hypothetical protein
VGRAPRIHALRYSRQRRGKEHHCGYIVGGHRKNLLNVEYLKGERDVACITCAGESSVTPVWIESPTHPLFRRN